MPLKLNISKTLMEAAYSDDEMTKYCDANFIKNANPKDYYNIINNTTDTAQQNKLKEAYLGETGNAIDVAAAAASGYGAGAGDGAGAGANAGAGAGISEPESVPEIYEQLYARAVDVLGNILEDNTVAMKTADSLQKILSNPKASEHNFVKNIYACFTNNNTLRLAIWLYKLATLCNGNNKPEMSKSVNDYIKGKPAPAGTGAPEPEKNDAEQKYVVPPCQPTFKSNDELNHLIVSALGKPMLNRNYSYLTKMLNGSTPKDEKIKIAQLISNEIRTSDCRPLMKVFGEKVSPKLILSSMIATKASFSQYNRRILMVNSINLFSDDVTASITVKPIKTSAMKAESIFNGYMTNPLIEASDIDMLDINDFDPLMEGPVDFFKGIFSRFKPKPKVDKFDVTFSEMPMTLGMLNQFYHPINPNTNQGVYTKYASLNATTDDPKKLNAYLYEQKGSETINISDKPIVNNYYLVKDICMGTELDYFISANEKTALFTIG